MKSAMASFIFILLSVVNSQVNFVAVGDDSALATFNSIAYSPDGAAWTPVADRIFSIDGLGVAYSLRQSKWVAVGEGTNTIAWSPNGTGWIGLGISALTTVGNDVAYSEEQDKWVAVGQGTAAIVHSPDGINWTPVLPTTFDIGGNGVEYSADANRWVAVGWSTTKIAWSPDGITWTSLGNIVFSNRGLSVAYANGLFVATGMTIRTQAWSSDGISWTPTLEFISNTRQDAAFGQNKWILAGPSPITFQTSEDGQTWDNVGSTAGLTSVFGVAYSSILNRWVAVGSSGVTANSPDGITWTLGSSPFSSQGWKVAARTGSAVNLVADVNNLITGTAIISTGFNVQVFGNFTVNGNLTVLGAWSIGIQAVVNVSGVLAISGVTNFNVTNPLFASSLVISVGAQLDLFVPSLPAIGSSISYPLANFNEVSGMFTVRSLRSAIQSPSECPTASQSYSSSTLGVLVTNSPCPIIAADVDTSGGVGGTSTPTNDPPIGMIVGVSVGVVVIAAGVTILIVALMMRRQKREDKIANEFLKKEELDKLKPSPGVNL